MTACSICDTRIDPHGRDGTRCARCYRPCATCGGDAMLCLHPLAAGDGRRGATMIDTPASFAAARISLGLDKAKLARVLRLGKDGRNTIRRIEQGQVPPGPYQLALEALLDGWRPAGVTLPIDKDTHNGK